MSGSKYRRLQVDRIWTRAFFEIAAIIAAIAICTSIVVSGYERSYAAYSNDYTTDNARQLARSVALLADRDTVDMANAERSEYAAEQYSRLLDECFISNDGVYSGAIYRVVGGQPISFAQSSGYAGSLRDAGLMDRSGSDYGALKSVVRDHISAASVGRASYEAFGDTYMAFEPVTGSAGESPYAVVVTQVSYRDSTDRDGAVRSRLIWISIVCGGLIIIYYLISAARSKHKTQKGDTVI